MILDSFGFSFGFSLIVLFFFFSFLSFLFEFQFNRTVTSPISLSHIFGKLHNGEYSSSDEVHRDYARLFEDFFGFYIPFSEEYTLVRSHLPLPPPNTNPLILITIGIINGSSWCFFAFCWGFRHIN